MPILNQFQNLYALQQLYQFSIFSKKQFSKFLIRNPLAFFHSLPKFFISAYISYWYKRTYIVHKTKNIQNLIIRLGRWISYSVYVSISICSCYKCLSLTLNDYKLLYFVFISSFIENIYITNLFNHFLAIIESLVIIIKKLNFIFSKINLNYFIGVFI